MMAEVIATLKRMFFTISLDQGKNEEIIAYS